MKDEIIKKFLNPKTIAVIGASNNPEKVGNILVKKLKKFKGELIPINTKEKLIEKTKTYKSILDYPKQIDLVIIAIPAKFVYKTLKQCGKKKIKNIVIITAGFSEKRHYKLTRQIIKAKKRYNLNILGPNCFGFFNPKSNIDLTFSNATPKKGSTAFISQSGALWSYASDLNLGFSGFVSLGNMIDLDFSDFIEYFIKDKSTKRIILYIEKLKEGKRFIEICKNSKKEIIVIKAGKTERGAKVTLSHTASLATDFEIYKSAFKQAKVKQKNSLTEALKLKSPEIIKEIKSKKVLIVTNAGGAGAILTDLLTQKGIEVIKIIDILGTAKSHDYKKTLEKIRTNLQIIVILTPQTMSQPEETAKIISESEHKEKIIAFFLGKKSLGNSLDILKNANVKFFTKGV